MSNLSVTEYDNTTLDARGETMPVATNPGVTIQNITFTATAGVSAAFDRNTKLVRVISDADCRILFGVSPTAVVTDMLLKAGSAEYFGVTPYLKISAVAA
jgi:hypothetical protein